MSLLDRALPVLGFLAAATVLAGLAGDAEVFDVAGAACARVARGRTAALWLLVALLVTVTTVLVSLDTAVVLLTPVVLATCASAGLEPVPFALLVVWLVNAGSLLLPVSNLTTLLAAGRLGLGSATYAGRMLLPECAAVVVSVAWVSLWHGRRLSPRYLAPPPRAPRDRALFATATGCCLALGPAVLAGVAPWLAALVAAGVLGVATCLRGRRSAVRPGLVPWRVLAITAALFAAVDGLTAAGLPRLLRPLIGTGELQTAFVAGGLANIANNLPSYLALEPAVGPGRDGQLLALLVGVNVGPLVLVTGSVATLLWRDRCRRSGVEIGALRFAVLGLTGVPLLLLACVAALQV